MSVLRVGMQFAILRAQLGPDYHLTYQRTVPNSHSTLQTGKMCQSSPQPKTNESESFVRQSFLRGHLAPAFQPPSKTCPRCHQSYTGVKTMCLPCIKAVYAEQEKDKDLSRDTYLDDCEMCKKTTLHLGPGWCVECYAASDAVFPLYCEECVIMCDVPVSVKDDKGGFVDMLKVRSLWCVSCHGPADSWVRLDY